jgi:signal transduction histidine kinase
MAIAHRARVVNQVPDELVVFADANLVRRIFENLLANAIDYVPRGTVTIGARGEDGEKPVECWVADDGEGIAPERLDKVFEPLETDPRRDGVGLGLAIVKTFVEAHQGRVWVDSAPGRGSTFRFTLPRGP